MNKLLLRQIKKYLSENPSLQETIQPFLKAVSDAYDASDEDRQLTERAFDLSSKEILRAKKNLQAEISEKERIEKVLAEGEKLLRATLESTLQPRPPRERRRTPWP